MKWKLRERVLDLSVPRVMGILNITPDSFSDGGLYQDLADALERALLMESEGADIIDVGAESSRPNSQGVSVEEEWDRLAPVLKGLSARLKVPISVDTRKGEIARRALDEGALAINDISGGRDPSLLSAVQETGAGYILMHMRGDPSDMMEHAQYRDVLQEVSEELGTSLREVLAEGIEKESLCVDPGFGFAKTPAQNYQLLDGLETFRGWGHPLMVGLSRKRMLRELVGEGEHALQAASVTAALLAAQRGAQILRVHDVAETVRALRSYIALTNH